MNETQQNTIHTEVAVLLFPFHQVKCGCIIFLLNLKYFHISHSLLTSDQISLVPSFVSPTKEVLFFNIYNLKTHLKK